MQKKSVLLSTGMLKELEAAARARGEFNFNPHHEIQFVVCNFCGKAEWYETVDLGEGAQSRVNIVGERVCQRCNATLMKAPHMFELINDIVNHQINQFKLQLIAAQSQPSIINPHDIN